MCLRFSLKRIRKDIIKQITIEGICSVNKMVPHSSQIHIVNQFSRKSNSKSVFQVTHNLTYKNLACKQLQRNVSNA